MGPLGMFWSVRKIRNGIAFGDETWSIQSRKISSFFFPFLWLETKKMSVMDGRSTLVDVIDCVGFT